jgi:hypothetical protein
MTKRRITSLWTLGLGIFLVGLVVAGVSLGLMFVYGGHFVAAASGSGYDFVPALGGTFWTTVGFMVAGGLTAVIGGVIQLVAWIGALVNTYQLADRTWFAVLLAGGLIGLAFGLAQIAVMVAYILAGPDGTSAQHERIPTAPPPQTPHPTTLAPT